MKKLKDINYTNNQGVKVRRKPESEEIVDKINEIIDYITKSNCRIVYLIVLVDNLDDAFKLNAIFNKLTTERLKIEAFSSLTAMVGLQHNTSRPTYILDAITDRKHIDFDKWYQECVLPNARNAVFL